MTPHSRGISLKEYKQRKAQDEFSDWHKLKIPSKGVVVKDEIIEKMNRSREIRENSTLILLLGLFAVVGVIQTLRWMLDWML